MSNEELPHSEGIHVPLDERPDLQGADRRLREVLEALGGDTEALARRLVAMEEENTNLRKENYDLARNEATGLEGGKRLTKYLTQKLQEARQNGGSIGIAFADLDGLKELNRVFGHPGADALLGVVGSWLQENSRHTDKTADGQPREKDAVFHPHGDELIMVLSDYRLHDEEKLEKLAAEDEKDIRIALREKMATMEKKVSANDDDIHVGITVGIIVSNGTETAREALTRASIKCNTRKDWKAEHDPRYAKVHHRPTVQSSQDGFVAMIVVLILMVIAAIIFVFMRVVQTG